MSIAAVAQTGARCRQTAKAILSPEQTEPSVQSAEYKFNLDYAVNILAMPMIGGTTTWLGPLVGAVLLGAAQQTATVTISSALNLLIVGVVLVAFVILAPEGIVGLVRRLMQRERA
jgi:ABC-type branched-subunit amino acid transport system permease subunit